MATLAPTACADTYHEVADLLRKIAWDFHRRFGGDIDELIADANYHFMHAYLHPTFDSSRARFSTWMAHVVWRQLVRDRRRRRKVLFCSDLEDVPCQEDAWSLSQFAEGLSADAGTVLELIRETPQELQSVLFDGTPSRNQKRLSQYLTESLGWTAERIHESFREITVALL